MTDTFHDKMADGVVNIAEDLLNKNVDLHRPPTEVATKDHLISSYAKELSSKTSKQSLFHRPSSGKLNPKPPSGKHIVRTLCGKKKLVATCGLKEGPVAAKEDKIQTTYCNQIQSEKGAHQNSDFCGQGLHFVKPRRVQSAKAKLSNGPSGDPGGVSLQTLKTRPLSAMQPNGLSTKDFLQPYIYGYKSRQQVFGNDIPSVESEFEVQNNNAESALCHNNWISLDQHLGIHEDRDDFAMPSSLGPLQPWRTEDIPQDWIGINPKKCLVFLPSLTKELDELPIIATRHSAADDLSYISKLTPPEQTIPVHYDHPWTKEPIEEWVCNHAKKTSSMLGNERLPCHDHICSTHTADKIHKEIQELEDLLKGIGTVAGNSKMACYQADITQVHTMLHGMLGQVKEIERREQKKLETQKPADLCGLQKFYHDHDSIIAKIRSRYSFCLQELALLDGSFKLRLTGLEDLYSNSYSSEGLDPDPEIASTPSPDDPRTDALIIDQTTILTPQPQGREEKSLDSVKSACYLSQGTSSDLNVLDPSEDNQNTYSAFARNKCIKSKDIRLKKVPVRPGSRGYSETMKGTSQQKSKDKAASVTDEVDPDQMFFDKQLEEAYLATEPDS